MTLALDNPYSLLTDEWTDKMVHDVPDVPSVFREKFLVKRCLDKTVLDIGHSGPMAKRIDRAARRAISVNKTPPADVVVDLDAEPEKLPTHFDVDLVVCGEVLEHLANPGNFLRVLRKVSAPVIVTVPNAFSKNQARWLAKGKECVNGDHVSWYSYHTLTMLVERYGFRVGEWYWYNGPPMTAEGLIFVLE
jgi:hypothetical protein